MQVFEKSRTIYIRFAKLNPRCVPKQTLHVFVQIWIVQPLRDSNHSSIFELRSGTCKIAMGIDHF